MEKREREVETKTLGREILWTREREGVTAALVRFKKERLYRALAGGEVLAFSPFTEDRFVVALAGEQHQGMWMKVEEMEVVRGLLEEFEVERRGGGPLTGGERQ